jgi:tetratricopeptide (TPR) repeat protein
VRAVRAAIGILSELPRLNAEIRQRVPELDESSIEVRIGIHTGLVVAGDLGSASAQEKDAIVGETPNLAARLQGIAEPDTVVISDATRRLVRGVFVLDELGSHPLKGIEEPVLVFRVLRASGVQSRLELAAAAGLTPLVGREQEVALLLARWEQVNEGHGQVMLLSGEAGMGKSRLVQVLHERLADERHSWLEVHCSAYHRNSAFHPVIELLEQALVLSRQDSAEEKLAKLEGALGRVGLAFPEVAPLFATLLSISLPERYPPLQQSPETQRRQTLESLAAWLFVLTEAQPMVLVVEDLHWIDPSTLEFLGLLLEQTPTIPLLLVLTFRPNFEASWPSRSHMTHLTLDPFTRKQSETMIEGVTGGKALPPVVLEQVVSKTDGVPLFLEELTKTVLESDLLRESDQGYERTDSLPELAIPSTLQDSLMARLDRLGPAKEVAQLGAVLGREFPHELLAAVSSLDAGPLERALRDLANAELLYPRGVAPRAIYTFKHALIQDTAYESLLKTTRRRLHGRIAEALEKDFPERAWVRPELVAHHYDRAGMVEEALPYYQRVGDEARARCANAEAIAHLERGVELTRLLPESIERDECELAFQVSLGPVLIAAYGHTNQNTQRAWERARELCRTGRNPSQLAAALGGLSRFYSNAIEFDTAIELADQLIALGNRTGEGITLVLGYNVRGLPEFWQGRFRKCLEHFDASIRVYEAENHAPLAMAYGTDQGVSAYVFSAIALAYMGYPERAAARAGRGIEQARKLAHPFSLAFALAMVATAYMSLRRWDLVERHAAEAIELCERYGFPFYLGLSTVNHALARASHSGEDTLVRATAGFADAAGTGQQAGAPAFLWAVARIHQEGGREVDALRAVESGLDTAAQGKQFFFDCELLHLKGELLLSKDKTAAESCLRNALELARRQEAKLFELRTATNLARLWQEQDKRNEARELLAPIYDWFTEGFDTEDLKEAKALLDELV